MAGRLLKLLFVAAQVLWMLVVLPGHARGAIALTGGPTAAASTPGLPSCCSAERADRPGRPAAPTPDQKSRCAVCFQAHGYTVPPVYDIDLAPSGLCELRRLIEPSKRHRLVCRPTYFATAPPAA